MNFKPLMPVLLSACLLTACAGGGNQNSGILPGADAQKTIQETLIKAKDGDTVRLAEGRFELTASLSLEGKKNVVFTGAGKDKTFLSFAKQTTGAEGLHVKNCQNFTVQNLTIEDTKGDGVKVQDTKGVKFLTMGMVWTGTPDSGNGAYGLYPVTCENVLIENCYIRGASDAGIYVGQSKNAIVRGNEVTENVAGIEIENTYNAEVYMNRVHHNTGGIMVFDLPDLPQKNGRNVRVYRNFIQDNNHPNFSAKGIMVYMVPAGVGFMVMATENVEVFENHIENHQSISFAAVSYAMTGKPMKDSLYNPYVSGIHAYLNKITVPENAMPDTTRDIGKMLLGLKQKNKTLPAIIFEGGYDPKKVKNGKTEDGAKICFHDNEGVLTYLNLTTGKTDLKELNCNLQPLPEVMIEGVGKYQYGGGDPHKGTSHGSHEHGEHGEHGHGEHNHAH